MEILLILGGYLKIELIVPFRHIKTTNKEFLFGYYSIFVFFIKNQVKNNRSNSYLNITYLLHNNI